MSKKENILKIIVKDYTTTPWPRYISLWDNSGEWFFQEAIEPKLNNLQNISKIEVFLDGVEAYTSSFLSESFWRLYKKLKDNNYLNLWEQMEFYSEEFPDKINFIKKEWPKYGIKYK